MHFLYSVTKQKICIPEDTFDDKTAVIFILARMEITAVLYFLRNGIKLHFYSLGTISEENIWGVQRGEIPRLWVSNRGEKHPCWHAILLAKSSVLYLLRPLMLERGCPTPDRHFSAAAEQADFVDCKRQKTRNLQ